MSKEKNTVSLCNSVTASELAQIIEMQLDHAERCPDDVKIMAPLLIHGSPGCGKSSVVRSVCERRGIDFIDCRLAQMEPCDIKGLPVPDRENKTMEWYVNGTWPRDEKGRGIIFLDEITSADRSIQVAAYELVLDRRLGKNYKIPPGYIVCAAGNNTDDKAVAVTMSSALANRFMHVELEDNSDVWLEWARSNDVHPVVVGFISYRRDMLFHMENENLERGWPSPRSWERVSQLCHMFDGGNETLLCKMVYGTVGQGAGVEFMEFYKLNSEFTNVLQVMTDPGADIEIPNRVDQKYAMCSAMVYLLWRGEDEADQRARVDGFFRICMKLSSDFAAMTFMSAVSAKDPAVAKKRAACLVNHPMFSVWQKKHGHALKRRASF